MNKNEECLKVLEDNYSGIKLLSNIENDQDGYLYAIQYNIIVSINRRWMGVIWVNDKEEEITFVVNSNNDYSKIDNEEERTLVQTLIEVITPYF
ncbi:hypothetical protein [Enterobacter hormaechei]|uniref:hypothetical protein n=1 Tax=Enterobacter hormaechei TaxID=158836 RepID=UPI001981FBFC|nr:hypothetical protein [Enterobacter hormaechei]MBN4787597.1 hypothetical protein [Enterobacter hormaechei]